MRSIAKEAKENKKNLREIRMKVGIVFQYPEYQLFEETVEMKEPTEQKTVVTKTMLDLYNIASYMFVCIVL